MAIKYKNAKVDLTTTGATAVLTPANATTAVIKSILASEDSGNADTITVTITDTAQPLVLAESEVLKAAAATANRLHVVASYMEIS